MDIWTLNMILRNRVNEKPVFPLVLQYGTSNSINPHSHNFIELVFVPSGTADHYYYLPNGKIVYQELIPGDIFIVPIGMSHSFTNGKSFFVTNICFDPVLIPQEFLKNKKLSGLNILFRKNPGMLHVNQDRRSELENCLNHIINELHEQKSHWREAVSGLFRYLMILLSRFPEKGTPEAMEYSPQIQKALDFLQNHLAEKITLRDLALAAGIGKSLLCQKFHKELGQTPWKMLNSIRIKKALFYLETRNRPSISETAYLCGFEDPGYFSRIFHRETGISPTAFRDGLEN